MARLHSLKERARNWSMLSCLCLELGLQIRRAIWGRLVVTWLSKMFCEGQTSMIPGILDIIVYLYARKVTCSLLFLVIGDLWIAYICMAWISAMLKQQASNPLSFNGLAQSFQNKSLCTVLYRHELNVVFKLEFNCLSCTVHHQGT